jgi:hypothetical protein
MEYAKIAKKSFLKVCYSSTFITTRLGIHLTGKI